MNLIEFQQALEHVQKLRQEAAFARLLNRRTSLRFRLAQTLIAWAAWLEPTRVQVIHKTA